MICPKSNATLFLRDEPQQRRGRNTPAPAALGVALLGFVLLAGCSSEPFPLTKVSGRVTYDDGSLIPAQRLVVTFVPQAEASAEAAGEKVAPPSGTAEVNVSDGTFDAVTSHRFGDGIVTGQHKVQVVALDGQNNLLPLVPKEYTRAATTPLTVSSDDAPFEIKVPKPQ